MTELDVVLSDCIAYNVEIAILTKDKISLEWCEDDDSFVAVLRSNDGIEYRGHFGCPEIDLTWTMKAWRYKAADGRELLLTEWTQDDAGYAGTCLFGLVPAAS